MASLTVEPGVAIDPCGWDLFLGDALKVTAQEGLLCISRSHADQRGRNGNIRTTNHRHEGIATGSPVLRTTEQIALCYASNPNEIKPRHLVPIAWVRSVDGKWQIFDMPRLESISPRAALPACITRPFARSTTRAVPLGTRLGQSNSALRSMCRRTKPSRYYASNGPI